MYVLAGVLEELRPHRKTRTSLFSVLQHQFGNEASALGTSQVDLAQTQLSLSHLLPDNKRPRFSSEAKESNVIRKLI